jgi:N-acetylmuramoyl-L-alanine amidase
MAAAGTEHDDTGAPDAARRRLIGGGALVLSLGAPQIAWGASLLGVRVWPAAEYTRVTLEHDIPLGFSHFALDNPARLVIDVDGIELTPKFRELVGKVESDDPFISNVRLGQNRPRVVRLVIELKQDIRPQVFAAAPVGPYQHRLVIDLHPLVPRDPLLALLQEQSQQGGVPLPGGEPIRQPIREPAREPAREAAREAGGDPGRDPATGSTDTRGLQRTRPAQLARVLTIAIDPGHGGEDPGAVGKRGTFEKNVTLSIARRLERLIEAEPRMRVLLTRDGDYFVPLGQRVARARRVQADLFVSIHADAWIKPDVRGSSVFALSERGATSTAAAWMARRENDADLVGGIDLGTQDPGLARVLLDLSTTAQISDSLRFGNAVLRELERVNELHKPRVEQAGFAVLKAPDIPSILVETAFISNPQEELRLKDEGYQQAMAQAMLKGIERYFTKHPPGARNPLG